ncbi:NYN domain-containing protein [uncultured Rikenella sp.]|uniref:NYN domain-containing protein n=1 Tax=uncultured Rikenella sp. TaxID=368003 RepID=UPI00261451B7|nr:NYN domain-containing protein [uncultured Rikenella sp.]
MQSNHNTPKIGVFYDGNFLLHASNYYNYIHPQRRRLSLNGLHDFICQRVAEEEGIDPKRCRVCEAHYFRGRLNAADAAARGSQLYHDRVFDDILMSEGVHTHYLPLRNIYGRKEERGTDVWLSLEVFEMALQGKIDIAVLVVADTDYVPLVRKLIAMGVRVMLISWEFEYTNDEGTRIVTKTSHELLNLAHYPVPMQEVIDCGLEQNNQLIMNLFVQTPDSRQGADGEDDSEYSPREKGSDTKEQERNPEARHTSQVLSLKNGYGFIKYPNNNLFFHSLDVIEGDFSEFTPGDEVEFSIDKNDQGQDVAKQVKRLGPGDASVKNSFWHNI